MCLMSKRSRQVVHTIQIKADKNLWSEFDRLRQKESFATRPDAFREMMRISIGRGSITQREDQRNEDKTESDIDIAAQRNTSL
jgi:metal-responsive CopG/Arc/MetJ family transcriptional regulator